MMNEWIWTGRGGFTSSGFRRIWTFLWQQRKSQRVYLLNSGGGRGYSDQCVRQSVCPSVHLQSLSFQSRSLSVNQSPPFHPFNEGRYSDQLFCLSVHLSVCLSICLSVHLSVSPSVCQSICLSVRLSVSPSACQSICLSIRLSVNQSICTSPVNHLLIRWSAA